MAIEIADEFPLKMVDLSIVMWLFTRGYFEQRVPDACLSSDI
jgi:hypothetical protein